MKPLVSVIVPSLNHVEYIQAALESVLSQTPQPEVIVRDGGSTDGTQDVLKGYGDRIRWVSEKDEGQSDAINKGFSEASGRWLTWLNSDDRLRPGTVEHLQRTVTGDPNCRVVYGDYAVIDARDQTLFVQKTIPVSAAALLLTTNCIGQQGVFFDRRLYEEQGGVDISLHYLMDYDLWLRFGAAGISFRHVKRVLGEFRWLQGSKTLQRDGRAAGENKRIYERHAAAILRNPPPWGSTRHKALRAWHRGLRQLRRCVLRGQINLRPRDRLMAHVRSS